MENKKLFLKKCPNCNSTRIEHSDFVKSSKYYMKFRCKRCGYSNVKECLKEWNKL
jgi:predicted Zn-ribbon and HTH transcriptional regulator